MVVADLDGTLLHDGETFEERFLTQRSIDVINRMHDNGVTFVVETARPVSTGFSFVEKLPVDAVAYLNGALIDFNPASSNYEMLTSPMLPEDGHLKKIGFSSQRACEVCKNLLNELPGMEVGIVMDDVRYTNSMLRNIGKHRPGDTLTSTMFLKASPISSLSSLTMSSGIRSVLLCPTILTYISLRDRSGC